MGIRCTLLYTSIKLQNPEVSRLYLKTTKCCLNGSGNDGNMLLKCVGVNHKSLLHLNLHLGKHSLHLSVPRSHKSYYRILQKNNRLINYTIMYWRWNQRVGTLYQIPPHLHVFPSFIYPTQTNTLIYYAPWRKFRRSKQLILLSYCCTVLSQIHAKNKYISGTTLNWLHVHVASYLHEWLKSSGVPTEGRMGRIATGGTSERGGIWPY